MKASKPATSAGSGSTVVEFGVGEDLGVQVVGQALLRRPAGEEGGQHGDAPGATLGGDVADRDRGVDGGGQEAAAPRPWS